MDQKNDNDYSKNNNSEHNNQNYSTSLPSPLPPVKLSDKDPYSTVVMQQQQQQQVNNVIHYHLCQQDVFFADQTHDMLKMANFKTHNLPLAKIKKIMKSDDDVHMIAAEAPVVFARACEMFILQLTRQSYGYTEESKRKTLQKTDIAMAISNNDIFDFLVDVLPTEDVKEEHSGVGLGSNSFYTVQ
ncbi:Nuclear transcription factor Y subunit C-2 [Zostera marina]|uniref:Nuclear transcription factor Y subunit C-2 n=1 Tax=Zostera marina TaxID=29655 RepID=A0A0K9P7J7_ZOSMR|nr:Nuclear transcription factor Y subunit C-2 [Zostera marina]